MYRANELSVVFEKVPWVGIKPKNLRSVETLTGNRPSNALSSSLSTCNHGACDVKPSEVANVFSKSFSVVSVVLWRS